MRKNVATNKMQIEKKIILNDFIRLNGLLGVMKLPIYYLFVFK